jgi:hypothetical protein
MADLLDKLRERTLPQPVEAKRGQNYNFPLMWFMRSDGDIVKLQGDPQNRAYYRDKGYVELRTNAPEGQVSEVEQWEKIERPKVLQQQRHKAAVINTIRRIEGRSPGVEVAADFDIMSIEECEQVLKDLGDKTGLPTTVVMGRVREASPAAEEKRVLAGVETTSSIEELHAKLEQTAEGMTRGTGYDPTVEARRRKV